MLDAIDTFEDRRLLLMLATATALVALAWLLPVTASGAPATEEYTLNIPGNGGNGGGNNNGGNGGSGSNNGGSGPSDSHVVPSTGSSTGTGDDTAPSGNGDRTRGSVTDGYDERRLAAGEAVVPAIPLAYDPGDGGGVRTGSGLPVALVILFGSLAVITGLATWTALKRRRAGSGC